MRQLHVNSERVKEHLAVGRRLLHLPAPMIEEPPGLLSTMTGTFERLGSSSARWHAPGCRLATAENGTTMRTGLPGTGKRLRVNRAGHARHRQD